MPTSMYEIVMLPNGDVVLQHVGQPEERVVKISFSADAKIYLQGAQLDVAKAMIDAGIDAVEQLNTDNMAELIEEVSEAEHAKILH